MVIKIAIVGNYVPGENKLFGGGDTHVDNLVSHLSRFDGVELHLITFGNVDKKFKKNESHIYVINKGLFYPFSIPIGMYRLKSTILKINPDIVHVQGIFFIYSVTAALILDKYPVLLTVHGILEKEFKFERGTSYLTKKYMSKPLEKYAISRFQNIIVCSNAMRDLVSNMTSSNIYVIPNGVDLKYFNDENESYSLVFG